jgi:hypothetical protein
MNIRNTLSIVAGVIASMIIIFIGEGISFKYNPLPASVDLKNILSIKAYIASAPASLHLMILLIYGIGCFAGGIVSAMVAIDKKIGKATTVGGILLGFGIYSLLNVGHPMWVIIVSLFVFLPSAYFGGRIGIKLTAKKD